MLQKIHKLSELILYFPRYLKQLIAMFVDVGTCILTVWLAYYLRLGEFVYLSEIGFWPVILSIVFALPIFIISGLYRVIFRYSGSSTILSVGKALAVYSLLYASIITAIGITGVPRTIGLIQPILFFLGVVVSRLIISFWFQRVSRKKNNNVDIKVLIYGAGNAGRQLASVIENSHEMMLLGYIDDNKNLHGHSLNNIPIYSFDELQNLIDMKNISHVLLALPSVERHIRQKIIDKLSIYPLTVRTLPNVNEIMNGSITIADIQDIEIEDLLGRTVVEPDPLLLLKKVKNKKVVVTGAGGSIGSELCRKILKLKPKKLLLIESSEYALYTVYSEIQEILKSLGSLEKDVVIPLLASVQDERRISKILETWSPNTIYHAAAYKHVPLVEYNIAEGVKNNVFGTLNIARLSIKNNVSDFVMISTDKAVRPTNAMGASKRLAEIVLQALFDSQGNEIKTIFSMVRFGNVLNSSGSVIPLFKKQIKDNGPVTITHKKITRYFMTVSEAANLVIQAGAIAKGGDVFILNMGKQISILDLAKRMIKLSGLQLRDKNNLNGDIEIKFTGLRPGEKLYEELLLGDRPETTRHPKILRAQDDFIQLAELEGYLNKLYEAIIVNDISLILNLLKKIINEYKPIENIVDRVYLEKTSNR